MSRLIFFIIIRDIASDVDLYNACSLDLAKFCRDVAHGDGKK